MSWAEELREMGSEGAPPRVEARLRAAFRERPAGGFAWLTAAAAATVILTVGGGYGGYWMARPATPVAPPAVLRAVAAPPATAFQKARIFRESPSPISHPPSPAEVATDFFPLQYGSDPRLLSNGTLVRVRLPRAVMDNFGFPVDAERRMERIQADVLLGGDGQAQAIRFVQPAPRLTRASY